MERLGGEGGGVIEADHVEVGNGSNMEPSPSDEPDFDDMRLDPDFIKLVGPDHVGPGRLT